MAFAAHNFEDLDGLAASLGMPELRDLSLSRLCNWIWWVQTRNCETEAERAKIKAKLWQPPAGAPEPTKGPWSPEAEMAAFNSLRRGLGK